MQLQALGQGVRWGLTLGMQLEMMSWLTLQLAAAFAHEGRGWKRKSFRGKVGRGCRSDSHLRSKGVESWVPEEKLTWPSCWPRVLASRFQPLDLRKVNLKFVACSCVRQVRVCKPRGLTSVRRAPPGSRGEGAGAFCSPVGAAPAGERSAPTPSYCV